MTTPKPHRLKRLLTDQRGATAIEYGLIASLVFLALVSGFTLFANSTTGMYNKIESSVTNSR